jgi:hypothetical protein
MEIGRNVPSITLRSIAQVPHLDQLPLERLDCFKQYLSAPDSIARTVAEKTQLASA